ncbi:MAG TPA: putative Ig domain-containing protein [Candidatus Saccharimonadales bacterium]|nr:putative Ig domain-containing protein [Candidatus Saccharimonadales bacterium]
MKTITFFRLLVLGIVACSAPSAEAAVTLVVNPASVAWNTPNPVSLNVASLANHQPILVEEFSDLNGNGSLDAGDPLILSFQVQDGEVPLFGGVRDSNRPGDEDGATNGQVRVDLVFGNLPERNRAIGNYLFRVSSTNNSFAPISQAFTVSQAGFAQSISGKVLNGATPVPSAFVGLLVAENDGDFVAGSATDAVGNFSINVPPGDYMLIALKPGYVCNFSTAPIVNVASGINSTQNVSVLPATRTISGAVIDATSSNGIPGVQLFVQSQDGQVALGFTDQAGTFSVPVTAGLWQLQPSETTTALLGYNKRKASVDTTTGDVSGVLMPLSRARGDLQLVFFFPNGSFGSGTSGQLAYPTHLEYYYALYNIDDFNLPTNVFFSGPAGSGFANTSSAIFGANFGGGSAWYSSPQINLPPYPPGGTYTVNYKNEPQPFNLSDAVAGSRQVILHPVVSVNGSSILEQITWTFRDVNGNTIAPPAFMANINIRIDGIGGRLYDAQLSPTETSHTLNQSVVWTNISSISMVYDDTLNNQYVAFWNRGTQPLQILSSSLPNGSVGTAYHYFPIGSGGLTPYSWSLLSSNMPPGFTFTPVTGEIGGTPTANGNYSFTVRLRDQNSQTRDQTLNVSVTGGSQPLTLQPLPLGGPNQFGLRLVGESGHNYELQSSSNLMNWSPLFSTNGSGTSIDLLDLNATNRSRFYRILRTP